MDIFNFNVFWLVWISRYEIHFKSNKYVTQGKVNKFEINTLIKFKSFWIKRKLNLD